MKSIPNGTKPKVIIHQQAVTSPWIWGFNPTENSWKRGTLRPAAAGAAQCMGEMAPGPFVLLSQP